MASPSYLHRYLIVISQLVFSCVLVHAVRRTNSEYGGHSTAGHFGQAITLVCDMNGRMTTDPMIWFYVDSQSYISKNDVLFPTLDQDRLDRYSAFMEPDFNQYMLRIEGLLVRDGGKFVCGYNDLVNNKFVPLWETTLAVFQPPEDNTLACEVSFIHTNSKGDKREIEVACSWNIELLNVDIALYQGRTMLTPDLEINGRMISRQRVGRFARVNNFRCVMIYPDMSRQTAQCLLPQREPRPVIHILPLLQAVHVGTSVDFSCETQNQGIRSGLVWTPNCADSPNLDICKRISLVNGGAALRISNPQVGDDGMLIQCSTVTVNGLMAAGVAQLRVESVPSTAGDMGPRGGRGGRGRGTDRGWTNPRERSAFIPVTTLEAEPINPTKGPRPEADYSNKSIYATVIPVVVVIVLLLLLAHAFINRFVSLYRKKRRDHSKETHDDHFFDHQGTASCLPREKVVHAVRCLPKLLQKARRSRSNRGKTAARRPPMAVTTAWSSRGSVPRRMAPISINPDLFRSPPFMSTAVTSAPISPPPKPPPKTPSRDEAHYQNTMPMRPAVIQRTDPKLILIRPSKRYDFVRISDDIARGYSNLRADAAIPKSCSITEDDYGYLVRKTRRHRKY